MTDAAGGHGPMKTEEEGEVAPCWVRLVYVGQRGRKEEVDSVHDSPSLGSIRLQPHVHGEPVSGGLGPMGAQPNHVDTTTLRHVSGPGRPNLA
jgi:hypothetical protein